MDNAESGAQAPLGAEQPSGAQQPVTAEQLSELRRELSQELTGAIKSWSGRLDIAGQVRSALESAGVSPEATAPGSRAEKQQAPTEVETLRKQLEAQSAELTRERKSNAIRAALGARGLTGPALDDAAALLANRDDIASEQDATGRRIWSGSVSTDLGPVTKSLEDVIDAWLNTSAHFLPAQHSGGTGASGGNPRGSGSTQPASLDEMTVEQMQENPQLARALARKARNAKAQTSPWG